METKIGTSFQIRSSFSGGSLSDIRNRARADQVRNMDIFEMSSSGGHMSEDKLREIKAFSKIARENYLNGRIIEVKNVKIAEDDYAERAMANVDIIGNYQNKLNTLMPEWLEKAGVPSDVTFEFDYNINT